MDRVVHFAAVNWYVLGCIESKSYFAAADVDDCNDDVVVDDDAFVLFAGQHEHSLSFAPGSSPLNTRVKLPDGVQVSAIS